MNKEKKLNNDYWWFIVARDGSCRGYIPAETGDEACRKFGMRYGHCIVRRVIWTDEGFVVADKFIQEKLL